MSEDPIIRRHFRAGWWGLLLFLVLGGVLETLHATKHPAYVDAASETTRLLLRLAHAHGTLLSLLNVAYALSARAQPSLVGKGSSAALVAALVLLPLGFFAGALGARSGDPGFGIVLVPPGAIALAIGVGIVARRT
jgi:hypothetical protein